MLNKKTHFHFMGIGGIGMSGIAKVLKEHGYIVSGCDVDMDQKSIRHLQERGCPIAGTHSSQLCHDPSIDVLVYSAAVNLNHPEMLHAHRRNIPVISRAKLLAELMRTKYSIAVAGAHGKTTTTTMISYILNQAQCNPSFVIGGFSKNLGTNARMGLGDFFVAEADESDRSLVYLPVTFAVITNIDREHLDTYKDLNDIVATFKKFLDNVPFYGKAIVCNDDPAIHDLLLPTIPHIKTITYGIEHEAEFTATNIIYNTQNTQATVRHNNVELGILHVALPGKHNLLNALAALAVSDEIGISFKESTEALAAFSGVERRFCYHGLYKGAQIFDDYAHHPKEIMNALAVARQRTKGKLVVVFQPHRFTRTYHLWNEFMQTFLESRTDQLIITDIFPASETPIENITSARFVQELQEKQPAFGVHYVALDDNFEAIIKHLDSSIGPDDLVLFLGAGKIFKIPEKLNL
jgi:UDP-N-acetylmuramate--alanine ligase